MGVQGQVHAPPKRASLSRPAGGTPFLPTLEAEPSPLPAQSRGAPPPIPPTPLHPNPGACVSGYRPRAKSSQLPKGGKKRQRGTVGKRRPPRRLATLRNAQKPRARTHPRCQDRPWGPHPAAGPLRLPGSSRPSAPAPRQAGRSSPSSGACDGADGPPGSRVTQAGGARCRRPGVPAGAVTGPSEDAGTAHITGFSSRKTGSVVWTWSGPDAGDS